MSYEEGDLDGACAICGRALDWRERSDGTGGHWAHSSEDEMIGVDHEPLHVSEQDIIPIYRCDFCSVDNPGFEIPAHSFDNTGGVPGANSVGNWMCCINCKLFVDDDDWTGLIDYVLRHNAVMVAEIAKGNFRRSDVRRFLMGSYADLRKNMIAKPVPIGTAPK